MSAKRKTKEASELEFLRHMLQVLVGSYVIGWFIIILFTRNIEFLDDITWRVSAIVVLLFTIWLAATLTVTATVWWASTTVLVATLRAVAYGMEGVLSAVGAWMLVLSGVSVTVMAIIAVSILTGRLPKEDK